MATLFDQSNCTVVNSLGVKVALNASVIQTTFAIWVAWAAHPVAALEAAELELDARDEALFEEELVDARLDDEATLDDEAGALELFKELETVELFTEELDIALLLEETAIVTEEDIADDTGGTVTELELIAKLDEEGVELFSDEDRAALEDESVITELAAELAGFSAASEEDVVAVEIETEDCVEDKLEDAPPPPQPLILQIKLMAPIRGTIFGGYMADSPELFLYR